MNQLSSSKESAPADDGKGRGYGPGDAIGSYPLPFNIARTGRLYFFLKHEHMYGNIEIYE